MRRPSLEECLYYAVREDLNCCRDPGHREKEDKILPALEFLAATEKPPDSPYVCPASLEAFCWAMHRPGRILELRRIRWLRLENPPEPKLSDV